MPITRTLMAEGISIADAIKRAHSRGQRQAAIRWLETWSAFATAHDVEGTIPAALVAKVVGSPGAEYLRDSRR